jgi:transcriptional regulator with PAS, ATPase and Fis domain
VEIIVPPLRKRGNDILLLAEHFIKLYSNKYLKTQLELDKTAKEKLLLYHYPGNVRELQYAIERAVIMAESNILSASDILFSPIESAHMEMERLEFSNLGAVEKNTILKVIEKNNGNISKAAKELGITRTALYRRLSKYDI